MNPRRRRRLRNQRKQRVQLHRAVWAAVHAAERSREAQKKKTANEKRRSGSQVILAMGIMSACGIGRVKQ